MTGFIKTTLVLLFISLIIIIVFFSKNQNNPTTSIKTPNEITNPNYIQSQNENNTKITLTNLNQLLTEYGELGDFFFKKASEIDDNHLGTSYSTIYSQEHKCYILGNILGQKKGVKAINLIKKDEIDFLKNTNIRTEEISEKLRITGQSLHIWAGEAEVILMMSPARLIYTWNIDCVTMNKLAGQVISINMELMDPFDVYDNTLYVLTDIESGFYEKFKSILERNPQIDRIALGSAGGSVDDAILSGLLIRVKGLDTILLNNCYSACPLIFMGGKVRNLWAPYPELGFHQVYIKKNNQLIPRSFNSEVYSNIRSYLNTLGDIDTEYVIRTMQSAGPETMNRPPRCDLAEKNVYHWVQRDCMVYQ